VSKRYRVVGIGNAIVDVLCPADDLFLDHMGITKGVMQLVERDRSEVLYAAMKERTEAPGGSVANTIAGIGNLGLSTAFIGRVRDDALGRFYAEALARDSTDFPNPPVRDRGSLPTSRSMIFFSPDGERSMNTYLGISSELGPDDVSSDVAGRADFLYLEGYLFDKPAGMSAFRKAAADCHSGGGRCGIALSDPFCVNRHRDAFRRLVRDEMDFVIGNQHEWQALYQTDDLDAALAMAAQDCALVACTRSAEEVIVIGPEGRQSAPVPKVTPVDVTGAGDLFAAGFIWGLAGGAPLGTAARMGIVAAQEVISHVGPRPQAPLLPLMRAAGLV
jgi:sugar/nucleoside kinase (ribokinase family)